jgi:hypothetical protein
MQVLRETFCRCEYGNYVRLGGIRRAGAGYRGIDRAYVARGG